MIRFLKVNILIISIILLNASLFGSNFNQNIFKKFPYLIYTGKNNEMKILWQLTNRYPCVLKWGLESLCNERSVKVSEYNKSHQYAIILSDLIPSNRYYYQVKAENIRFKGSFKSAPSVNDSSTAFFVYGDTQFDPAVHNKIAKQIIEFSRKNDFFQTFVLHTGDITDDGAKESFWNRELFNPRYIYILKLLGSFPFQACLGNHDMDYYGNSSLFAKYFSYPFTKGRYWSFDYGPAHFFMFDIFSGYGGVRGYEKFFFEQLDYLKDDLSSTDKEWKFVVLHEPGWTIDKEHNWRVREYLQPICKKYKVDIVFAGHHHLYSRAKVDGVHHITTGGGGGRLSFYKQSIIDDKIIFAKRIHHYCQVVINGKTLHLTAYNLNGVKIDEFEISH